MLSLKQMLGEGPAILNFVNRFPNNSSCISGTTLLVHKVILLHYYTNRFNILLLYKELLHL